MSIGFEKPRNCQTCFTSSSSKPGSSQPKNPLYAPLIVQCNSPFIQTPSCQIEEGQVLLAIESGRFYYWGKKQNPSQSGCKHTWIEAKCGECAPISFRQSQIFFQEGFNGTDPVLGPERGTNVGRAVPQPGDYLIDSENHTLWLFHKDGTWQIEIASFGGTEIDDTSTATDKVWSAAKISAELAALGGDIEGLDASAITSGMFVDERISVTSVTQHSGAIQHQNLSGAGTNTHMQIDSHIADASKHRVINDASLTTIDLWSASKISSELSTKSGISHTHDASSITTGVFNNARIGQSNVTQHVGALQHQLLAGAGSKNHSQIDAHIDDVSIHRSINDNGTGATDLWSAEKLIQQFSGKSDTTHTHLAVNISDFSTAVDTRISAQKGIALGLATLDGTGKVPAWQLELNSVTYQGTWNAATNSPTIVNGTGHKGNYYVVSTAGNTTIDGQNDWKTGDWIIFNGTLWEKTDHTDQVTSVAGKQGAVTLVAADITDFDTKVESNVSVAAATSHLTNTLNPHNVTKAQVGLGYVENIKVKLDASNPPTVNDDETGGYSVGSQWYDIVANRSYACVDSAAGAAIWRHSDIESHTDLTDIGINTHAQIDTHIADATKHRQINDAGITATDLWSASKIITSLAAKANTSHTHAASDVTSGTFADARIAQSNVTQHVAALVHQSLSGAGTNTHAQIDTHIADATKHRQINDAGSSSTELWSASKINTELANKSAVGHTHAASDVVSGTFADARISQSSVTQHNAALAHQSLSGAGTNTHAQIDTHIADATKHRVINDSGTATTELWSASKIFSELGNKSNTNHTHVASNITDFATAVSSNVDVAAATAHVQNLNNPHAVTKSQVGLSNVPNLKMKLDASVAPTATDDITKGYDIGSVWINVQAQRIYQCANATANSAVWKLLDIKDHTELLNVGTNTHAQIDSHIADATKHRVINDSGSSTTDLWSASNIASQLSGKASAVHVHAASDVTSGTFADARISQSSVVQYVGALEHQSLSGAGTNTHAQIDSHIADVTKHRSINDAGTATTDLWSADKITTELATKATAAHTHDASGIVSGTFANARIAQSNVTQHNAALVHQTLSGAGTFTHSQIDTHITDATKHRQINDAGVSTTDLWSASKITTELAAKSNTTHTHTAADITNFSTSVDARITLQKGVANGLASLDATGKIPTSQLQLDSITYQGTWNASTNTPTLTSSSGTKGYYYVVNTAGTTNINGITDWQPSDWIIFNGSVWEKADHSDQVTSVAGKQGAVTLVAADITNFNSAVSANTDVAASVTHASNMSNPHNVTKAQVGLGNVPNLKYNLTATTNPTSIDDTSAGYSVGSIWTNTLLKRYYTCVDATTGAAIWQQAGIESHTDLTNIGTNTHAQIDTHIADATKHRQINDSGSATTDLWSASKITSSLATKAASVHTHAASDVTSGTFADARIAQSNVTQHVAALVHQSLSGAGTNTHAQIDTHIADATKHRVINDAGTGTTDLWSASKISTDLAGKSAVGHVHAAGDVTSGVFANARISQSSVTQYNAALLHQSLSGAGTNTHDQIDSHIADVGKHREINDSGVATTDLWSASKILTELSTKSPVGHTHFVSSINGFSAAVSANDDVAANTAHRLDVSTNPHAVTKAQVGLGNVPNLKVNLSATVPPVATDDSNSGYSVGSTWTDTVGQKSYICLNAAVGGAVWRRVDVVSHTDLSNIGTNTHAQIDTHIADATKHRQINDSGTATTDLWSASKISADLATKAASVHTHVASDITTGTFADARIAQSNVTQHVGALVHQSLSGAGTNTHAQIDTHIADATKHRIINDAGTSTTELWSASKINTGLSGKADTVHVHSTADITSGTFADARIAQSNVTQHVAALLHQSLSGAGTNTHAQIDTHIADATKHRIINDAGTSTTELWSASKINTSLGTKANTTHTHAASDVTSGTFADARIAQSNVTQHVAALVHQSLSGAGTNTHAQIDTHIADATKHRQINDSGSATTDLWSASKITSSLATKANTSHTHLATDITNFAAALPIASTTVNGIVTTDAQSFTGLKTFVPKNGDNALQIRVNKNPISGFSPSGDLFIAGSDNNSFITTFAPETITENRTITVPNASDTMALLNTTQTFTNKTLIQPEIATIANNGGVLTLPDGDDDTLMGRDTIDTVTGKTFTDDGNAWACSSNLNNKLLFDIDPSGSHIVRIFTLPGSGIDTVRIPILSGGTDTFVLAALAQTLTNKTLTNPTISSIQNGGIITLPSGTHTLVSRTSTDTLTNKTLTNPTISSINNAGTLVLPTGADTLVGRATTDTLTNKTLTSTTNTIRATSIATAGADVVFSTATAPSGAGKIPMTTSATEIAWVDATAGSNTQVLYNNNNAVAGTSKLTIDSDEYAIVGDKSGAAPSMSIDGCKIFSKYRAGRRTLAQNTSTGLEYSFQPYLFAQKITFWSAQGNGTAVSTINFGATNTGTLTARTVATTNFFTSVRRLGFVSTTTAGTSAGTRHAQTQFFRGNGTNGVGGFYYVVRFGISSAATVATQRTFVGLYNSVSVIGNVEPSSLTNILGFACDSTDSSFTFMHNDASGTATKDALTGTFPARSLSTDMYEARIYSPPNASIVYYSLEVLGGGSFYEGSTSNDLPLNTTLLSPQIWTNNGTTALACGIDVVSQYLETDT